MQLIVLGSRGAYPSRENGTSGFLLRTRRGDWLLDCGSGALAACQQYVPLEALSGVILSHLHADHACELPLLGYALQGRKEKLPVYAPKTPEHAWQSLNHPVFDWRELGAAQDPNAAQAPDATQNPAIAQDPNTPQAPNGRTIQARPVQHPVPDDMLMAALTIQAWPTRHPFPGYMLRLEADGEVLSYSGDTLLTTDLARCAHRANVLLCNAAWTAERLGQAPHLSGRQAAQTAAQARVGRLLLSHIMPRESPAELLREAQTEFADAALALPDMVVELTS